jgi:serine protease Do
MTTMLGGLGDEIRAIAERAGGGVARIDGGWRPASGVVVRDGLVLTNAHNVGGERARLTFPDGRTSEGIVAGVDLDGDLAVITADTEGATPLRLEAVRPARIGDPAFAVAATADGPRVTFGFVSGVARAFRGPRGRRIAGSIEHTAPLAPGSSGSALLDADGRLVGLNTNRVGGGFYLAIPTDESLRLRIDALARGEVSETPRLGVALATSGVARRMRRAVGLTELDGALVREVASDGPAARAGIAVGDLIVSASGAPVLDADDLADALVAARGTGTLELGVVRGVEERTLIVELSAP